MKGFTKLFQSIVTSSIWAEDDKTRIVWITMLAMCDEDGVVEASIVGLSHLSRVGDEDCRRAVKVLCSPDPNSRSTEFEGRRIEKIDGGWRILNHAKYRNKMNADQRREYLRKKQKEFRDRRKALQRGLTVTEIIQERTAAEEEMNRIDPPE